MGAEEQNGSVQFVNIAQRRSQETPENGQPSTCSRDEVSLHTPRPDYLNSDLPSSPLQLEEPKNYTALLSGEDGGFQADNEENRNSDVVGLTTQEVDNGRKPSQIARNLRVDTSGSKYRSSNTTSPKTPAFPLNSQISDPSARYYVQESPQFLPISPRNRGRRFSLRRSLLSRSAHEQSGSSTSVIELRSAISSPPQNQLIRAQGNGMEETQKTAPNVIVSPVNDQSDDGNYSLPKPGKRDVSMSSLPHYEMWLANKVPRSGFLTKFKAAKETIRRKILRIQEKPPSKDGRHITLGLTNKKPLIDDRTGHEHISNFILSTRYSLYNFLPRQLFAQFSKLANFYFLSVSILQMIPGLSTTGTYTTIVPLLFFVTISIAKEGYDDLRRYRLDKAENNRTASILCAFKNQPAASSVTDSLAYSSDRLGNWTETKWHSIRVGDVVKLGRDDGVPADIVLLQATGTDSTAYVDTVALDGETNLKTKYASPLVARKLETLKAIASCEAHFVVEDPNLNLYNFEGKVTIGGEVLPLTTSEIMYRGSVVRNTSEVIGMVIYTGEECKIRMNATKNPRIKAPALQAVVNKVVIILVIFVIILALFNTLAYQIWRQNVEEEAWYLDDAAVAFFPILVSFIIIFNTLIPLSLYVSLEIVKLFQMLLMNDIDMYDARSNTPMEARTSTINEELGQVNYIFSDKTGTLTNNSMRFRKLSIAGTAWLHDVDLIDEGAKEAHVQHGFVPKIHSKGKKPLRWKASTYSTSNSEHLSLSNPCARAPDVLGVRNGSGVSRYPPPADRPPHQQELSTTELIDYIQHRSHTSFARKVHFFLLTMALCHTCHPEKKADGAIEYQAASPDEQALVRAAQDLGYVVFDRQNGTITIKILPVNKGGESRYDVYQILDVIEFSSQRKRMSVIVRMPDHRICVFCKGADSVLVQLLRQADLAMSKAVEVEQRANQRQSLEAQFVIRRQSEAKNRKDSVNRKGVSISRPSIGDSTRLSMTAGRLRPTSDEIHHWLAERETDFNSPRPSMHYAANQQYTNLDWRPTFHDVSDGELVEEGFIVDDATIFERCFQHINSFASEGLRTLLYGYKNIEEDDYKAWKKLYIDASTSLDNRQEKVEKAGAMIERDLELAAATAIEDRLQDGVGEAIDKLRRAQIKLWMLTGDKRETAINIGHSCRLIKDYSTLTILDLESGDVGQRIAAATLDMSGGSVAHAVIVVDGHTLSHIMASFSLRRHFLSLATQVDTVICCRASPSQKASLVSSIRHTVKNAITLAIGDGANDIAMIQEAHVGIGITGKEGLQAARTSDYSIAQFRFLTKLLLVHGRWNYIRTCKYTLGTFWKEMTFYLTQALYQRYVGYTGTSLYESWSLSMFNTLFTSLPVIFLGIFEKDLKATTLLAVPELYHSLGHRNGGFNIQMYLVWVAMAATQAVVIFFIMLGLYGQALFTTDNGLYAMGDLTFTACIIIIAVKMQFFELSNKTYTSIISTFLSIGGWLLWNVILSSSYSNNVIYNVKDGFFDRFGKNPLWWLTLILIVIACWAIEVGFKTVKGLWFPDDVDVFQELEKDPVINRRFEAAAAVDLAASISSNDLDGTVMETGFGVIRTVFKDKEPEDEAQEMPSRPRHSQVTSGSNEVEIESPSRIRRRQPSDAEAKSPQEHKVSFAVADNSLGKNDDDDNNDNDDDGNANGQGVLRRRSTDVQDRLRRGFGSIKKGCDIV